MIGSPYLMGQSPPCKKGTLNIYLNITSILSILPHGVQEGAEIEDKNNLHHFGLIRSYSKVADNFNKSVTEICQFMKSLNTKFSQYRYLNARGWLGETAGNNISPSESWRVDQKPSSTIIHDMVDEVCCLNTILFNGV